MMGYIVMPSGPADSTKAVVSVWFRIPSESYSNAYSTISSTESFLYGAIPVVTFGPQVTADSPGGSTDNVGSSWIGVVYNAGWTQDGSPNPPGEAIGDLPPPGGGFGLGFNLQFTSMGARDEFNDTHFPENIMMGITAIGGNTFFYPTIIPVSSDKWHHLLMSWEINGMAGNPFNPGDIITNDWSPGISGGAKIYLALDDKYLSYTPDDLNFWPCGGYVDGNTWVTVSCFNSASAFTDEETSFSWGGDPVPMSSAPFGLPSAGVTKYNYRVELAEFQMFTDTVLDVSNADNRRVFIDDKGKPVNPDVAKKMLGSPVVLLHTSGNWIKGNNTGRGINFSPTGKIKQYKPNPSLHGPQS